MVLQASLNLYQDKDEEYLFCLGNSCRMKLKCLTFQKRRELREKNVFEDKWKSYLSQSSILHLDILILLLQLSKCILQFVDF